MRRKTIIAKAVRGPWERDPRAGTSRATRTQYVTSRRPGACKFSACQRPCAARKSSIVPSKRVPSPRHKHRGTQTKATLTWMLHDCNRVNLDTGYDICFASSISFDMKKTRHEHDGEEYARAVDEYRGHDLAQRCQGMLESTMA